jgi:hypothetical protein
MTSWPVSSLEVWPFLWKAIGVHIKRINAHPILSPVWMGTKVLGGAGSVTVCLAPYHDLRGLSHRSLTRLSEAFTLMKRRGSSIGGADEVENGIRHPLITNNETKAIFVPLGPWAVGT